jgi:RNA polymerase sigma factor (sigma-70 family)
MALTASTMTPARPPAVAAAGNAESRCVELHLRLRRPLERFFRSYRLNAHDVADLTQEVFLRLSSTRCPTDLRRPDAYVFTLARNLLRDRARRLHTQAAKVSVGLDDVELISAAATPEESLEHAERLTEVMATIDKLKPAARRAFLLHRLHGYSYAEIARDAGVSVSMIEKHVMSAMLALRQHSA